MTRIVKRARRERTGTARTDSLPATNGQAMFIAVVHAADGVRFAAAAESRYELVHRIADYVRQWGKRWDKEWLVTAVATTDGRRGVAGVLGEVVVPEALREQPREPIAMEPEQTIALARAL